MEKQIKLFLEFLQNDKKLSNNTLQSYERDILQYQDYVEENKINYAKADQSDLKKYLDHLSEIGKKPSTISRNLATIRSFYQFLLRNRKIKEDPTANLQAPKIEKRVPSILTSQEVELLLEQPKNVDLKGSRDKAMLELAYATGMRVTEIINLNREDVNLKEGFVTCTNQNKQRNIPIGSISAKALKEYIDNARPILVKDENYFTTCFKSFFCNAPFTKWSRFKSNSNNAWTFRYFIYSSIYAIPKSRIKECI